LILVLAHSWDVKLVGELCLEGLFGFVKAVEALRPLLASSPPPCLPSALSVSDFLPSRRWRDQRHTVNGLGLGSAQQHSGQHYVKA
jgi:hypothetical protein